MSYLNKRGITCPLFYVFRNICSLEYHSDNDFAAKNVILLFAFVLCVTVLFFFLHKIIMMFVLYLKLVSISSDEPCETFVLNYGIWRVKSRFESVGIFTLSIGFVSYSCKCTLQIVLIAVRFIIYLFSQNNVY